MNEDDENLEFEAPSRPYYTQHAATSLFAEDMQQERGKWGFNTDPGATREQQANLVDFPASEANEWFASESAGFGINDVLPDFRSWRSGFSDYRCDSERDYIQRRWQEDLQGADNALKQHDEEKEEFDPVQRATYERLFAQEALEV